MPENGDRRETRRAVARDPLAELGEIELTGVLRRVRPSEPASRETEAGPRPPAVPGGGLSLSGRSPLPGAALAGRVPAEPREPVPREIVQERPPAPELRGPGIPERRFEQRGEAVAPEAFAPPTPSRRDGESQVEGAALGFSTVSHVETSPASEPQDEARDPGPETEARAPSGAAMEEDAEIGDGPFIDGRSSVRLQARVVGARAPGYDPSETEQRYAEGKRYAAAGQFARAIEAYHEVLRRDPRHVRARNNLGFAYDCRGDYDLAINEYLAALELDPKNVQIWCNLGAVYGAKGRYDRADEALRQAVRLDPKSAEAHCNLGIVYCKKGMYHLATAELKRALELRADYVQAHYYLGECYNHLDRHEEAIQAFEKALEGQPQNHKAYYNLGILYDKKNMPDRAMLMYRRAREIQTGSGRAPGP